MVFHSSFFSTFFYYFFAICMFLYTSNFFVWLRDKKSERKILYQKVFRKTWSLFWSWESKGPTPWRRLKAFLQILKKIMVVNPKTPMILRTAYCLTRYVTELYKHIGRLGLNFGDWGPRPISRVFWVLLCVQQMGGGIGGWKPAFVRDNSGSLDHVELERDWYPPES